MGQTSSQPRPPTDPPGVVEKQSTSSGNAPKHRKPKVKKAKSRGERVTENHMEEQADEYAQAASSQLMSEFDPKALKEVVNQRKRKRTSDGDKKRSKRKRAYGKSTPQDIESDHAYSQDENFELAAAAGEMSDGTNDDLDDIERNHGALPSTLDDINSDDEDVAAFMRDFRPPESATPPFDTQEEQTMEDEQEEAMPTMLLSSSPPHLSHGFQQQYKGKKRQRSADIETALPQVNDSAEENNSSLSDTGQHTLDLDSSIDFEAFDKYCAANGLGSANIFEADQVLPGLEDMQRHSSQEYHRPATTSTSQSQVAYSGDLGDSAGVSTDPKKTASRSKGKSSVRAKVLPVSESSVEEISAKAGAFTGAERTKLEKFRDSYCEENDISTWEFNDMVQANIRDKPKAKDMWQEIYEIVSYRKKSSVQRFCRRRFHNFDVRGAWNDEDDKLLARAVDEKGKSWKAVGQIMNRSPEDVRDRWRNYLVNAESRNTEQWTNVEIRNLVLAVHECKQIMKQAKEEEKLKKYEGREIPDSEPDSDQEAADSKLINWQVVSDRMGGCRSRLQCSFKWGKMKKQVRDQYTKDIQAAANSLERVDREKKPAKNPWRQKKADMRVREMRPGDVYEFLQALSTCGAATEDNIPWISLGDDTLRERWTTADRKAAWRMLKGSIVNADGYGYLEIVNHLLSNLLENARDRLDDKWNPAVDGYGQAPVPKTKILDPDEKKKKRREDKLRRQRERRQAKQARRGPTEWRSKVSSSQFVGDSDEEDLDP